MVASALKVRLEDGSGSVSEPHDLSGGSEKVPFLGIAFDPLGVDEAVGLITAQASRLERFRFVTTPNVDHRVRLEREPHLMGHYDRAWLTLCDSRVLPVLAWMVGEHLPTAAGADVVERLFEDEIDPAETVVVVGASEKVVDGLVRRFGLKDIRWHCPPMGLRGKPDAIDAAARFVAANPARFTFIAVGSPQQEMVAARIVESGAAVGVGMCCGASLEFLAGTVSRAPRWMRRIALEWLHRLASRPKTLARRYLIDGPRILPIWIEQSVKRPRPPRSIQSVRDTNNAPPAARRP